jgi:SAM-dependent methyltransferase
MFNDLTQVYEALVDWPKRLANEEPFYRQLFARLRAQSVVDVACGTGHHAAMFSHWGLRVEGADLSADMIETARANFGESQQGLRWMARSFDEPIETGPFDVALCVGNSLALAPEPSVARQAIRQMLAAVRTGGAVVVQVLNLWHLPDGPCNWQKVRPATFPELSPHELLIVKGVHRSGGRGYVDLIVLDLSEKTRLLSESTPFLGLEATDLEQTARSAGANTVTFFGGYHDEPHNRLASVDLLMVAEK